MNQETKLLWIGIRNGLIIFIPIEVLILYLIFK